MLRAIACAALVAAVLCAAPAAAAPESGSHRAIGVKVFKRTVPKQLGKLADRGVAVRARCTEFCRVLVRLTVTKDQARALGLSRTLIGRGISDAPAGQTITARAFLTGEARKRLLAVNPEVFYLTTRVVAKPPRTCGGGPCGVL